MVNATVSIQDPVTVLRDGLTKLPPKDLNFAQSLLRARKPTPKQMYWIEQLAGKILNPPPPLPVQKASISLDALYAMLESAKKHIKWPMIRYFLSDGSDRELRFYLSGPTSKVPNVINVKDNRGGWYGRLLRNGEWQGKAPYSEMQKPIEELAADPVKALAENGKMANRCCFCGLLLTDDRSVQVGYGPVCADHFNLPWGKATTAQQTEA